VLRTLKVFKKTSISRTKDGKEKWKWDNIKMDPGEMEGAVWTELVLFRIRTRGELL
jgi:hypothetical protein